MPEVIMHPAYFMPNRVANFIDFWLGWDDLRSGLQYAGVRGRFGMGQRRPLRQGNPATEMEALMRWRFHKFSNTWSKWEGMRTLNFGLNIYFGAGWFGFTVFGFGAVWHKEAE
jgi:hypothetical protein